jgi:hypothetical protein
MNEDLMDAFIKLRLYCCLNSPTLITALFLLTYLLIYLSILKVYFWFNFYTYIIWDTLIVQLFYCVFFVHFYISTLTLLCPLLYIWYRSIVSLDQVCFLLSCSERTKSLENTIAFAYLLFWLDQNALLLRLGLIFMSLYWYRTSTSTYTCHLFGLAFALPFLFPIGLWIVFLLVLGIRLVLCLLISRGLVHDLDFEHALD